MVGCLFVQIRNQFLQVFTVHVYHLYTQKLVCKPVFKCTELCDMNNPMMVLFRPLHELLARGGSLMTTSMGMLLT